MDILHAVILGIVEGITEFLPISSTGHLILVSNLLHIPQTEFLKTFEIAIQLGAICAVVALYFKKFFDPLILKKLFIAFLPTAVIGLTFYTIVKTYLLGNELVVLGALLIGGIALIAFEMWHTENESGASEIKDITYTQAALIGIFQSLAIVPGVSRSASTIVGGLFLGLKRITIVEFSFLLAVPTMAAATGLDVIKNINVFTTDNLLVLVVGSITSFIVALLSITFLLSFIRQHSFIPFGVYRIGIALLFFIFVIL